MSKLSKKWRKVPLGRFLNQKWNNEKNIYALERSSLLGQTIIGPFVMIFNQKWNDEKKTFMIWNGLAY